MIFRFFKQMAAPSIFSKGITQYHNGQYGIARQLFSKTEEWMPSISTDSLYRAATLLCDLHLNGADNIQQARHLLNELTASPHKDTPQYAGIIAELKKLIDTEPPSEKP